MSCAAFSCLLPTEKGCPLLVLDTVFFINSHSREIASGLQHKHSLSPNIYLPNLTGAKLQSDNLEPLISHRLKQVGFTGLFINAGNMEFSKAKKTIWEGIVKMDLPEVDYFIKHFIPSFELTLDELNLKESKN
jgi:hypothetical protein